MIALRIKNVKHFMSQFLGGDAFDSFLLEQASISTYCTFTIDGQELTTAMALDTDGDFTPDSEEAVFDGAFHESYFQSAPYFALQIDGIEWLNSAF